MKKLYQVFAGAVSLAMAAVMGVVTYYSTALPDHFYVAAGAANLVNLLEPDALIIGGGISAQGEKILEPIRRRIRELAYIPAMADRCRIAAAQLGNDAGIIGAAFLGRQYGADAR